MDVRLGEMRLKGVNTNIELAGLAVLLTDGDGRRGLLVLRRRLTIRRMLVYDGRRKRWISYVVPKVFVTVVVREVLKVTSATSGMPNLTSAPSPIATDACSALCQYVSRDSYA